MTKIESKTSNIINNKTNPFEWSSCNIVRLNYINLISLQKFLDDENCLNISSISLPRNIVEFQSYNIINDSKEYNDYNLGYRKIGVFYKDYKKYFESYISYINIALKEMKANIICINELVIPTYKGRPYIKALKFLRQKANEYNALIISGSAYDTRTLYNTAYIFYPNCPNYGLQYNKQISASYSGEYINVPSDRIAYILRAFGLNIGILIGQDIFDYSSVSPFTQFSAGLDILFVPYHSKKIGIFNKLAEYISINLRGIVSLTNSSSNDVSSSNFYELVS